MEQSGEILLKIAPPVMFAQLIQVLYNIIDSFFVGKYSANALTALTVVCPLQLVIIALSVGTGVGVNTYMAAAWATVCGQAVSAMITGIKGFRRPPELGLAGADHRAVLKKRGNTIGNAAFPIIGTSFFSAVFADAPSLFSGARGWKDKPSAYGIFMVCCCGVSVPEWEQGLQECRQRRELPPTMMKIWYYDGLNVYSG